MKYLKKIFENIEVNINNKFDDLKEYFIDLKDIYDLDVKIDYIVKSRGEFVEYPDYDGDDIIKGIGYIIKIDYKSILRNRYNNIDNIKKASKYLIKLSEILESIYKSVKSVEAGLELKFIKMHLIEDGDDSTINIYFENKFIEKNEYYYFLKNEIEHYINDNDDYFKNISINKEGKDYYIIFNHFEKISNEKESIIFFKEWMKNVFDNIKYQEFIYLNETSFKIKNPTVSFLNLKLT